MATVSTSGGTMDVTLSSCVCPLPGYSRFRLSCFRRTNFVHHLGYWRHQPHVLLPEGIYPWFSSSLKFQSFSRREKNFTRSTHTGDVLLRVSDEGGSRLLQLSGALLVPDVPMNIISVSRLDERGCCTTIANGRLAVSRAATAAPVLVAYKSKATNLYCVH